MSEAYNRGHAGTGARIRKQSDPVPRRGSTPITIKKDREWRCHKCGVLCSDLVTWEIHMRYCEVKNE